MRAVFEYIFIYIQIKLFILHFGNFSVLHNLVYIFLEGEGSFQRVAITFNFVGMAST